MNCLLNALAMSFGLMCVLSLNVMELLSCCVGHLCARPCSVFPPDICLVCVYDGGDFFI